MSIESCGFPRRDNGVFVRITPADQEEVHLALLMATKQRGRGIKELAFKAGVSQSIISEMRTRRGPISSKIAQLLGYEVKVTYVRVR